MNESIPNELFAILDTVVLEHLDECYFKVIGNVPKWFIQFYPNVTSEEDEIDIQTKFPFMENFIIDAEDFWRENIAQRLKSGLWSEMDMSGQEYHLEASAVRLGNKKILLIELLDIAYEEKQSLIQKARQNNLTYHYLLKETQKKEILIHCILHDVAGQLTGINCCFALLAMENLTAKGRERLEIGKKQSIKQEMLIQEILKAFSAEVKSLEDFTADSAQAPDALRCAREVVEALLPTFSLNKRILQLEPNIDMAQDWKVVGENSRLERVLFNLVENAFRHSPLGSTVTVDVKQDGEFILFTVDDEGAGVPEGISKNLFQKFAQGRENSGKAGLGLYFCRITVERWGGSIGYSTRPEGGSCFWFRLPRAVLQVQKPND